MLDEDAMIATVDGEPVSLTLREFQILFKLLSYPKRTFTRSQLMDEFCRHFQMRPILYVCEAAQKTAS